jgi:hypothetical protein
MSVTSGATASPGSTSRLEGTTDHAESRRSRCTASGWRLRSACTDGQGSAICPVCGEQVGADPDAEIGPEVRVIEEHGS